MQSLRVIKSKSHVPTAVCSAPFIILFIDIFCKAVTWYFRSRNIEGKVITYKETNVLPRLYANLAKVNSGNQKYAESFLNLVLFQKKKEGFCKVQKGGSLPLAPKKALLPL